ncbi:MAG TPA: histidine phosphatase family protein [Chthoniobacterales bacterium]|jgi:broad specificity phosphatase PhoE
MKRLIALLLFPLLLVSEAAAQSTIFLVRHAEKAPSSDQDPDLSAAGRARAESLATVLKDCGISTIFVTEFKRTQQTAAPLAKMLHLDPAIVPAKDSAALVARLRGLTGNTLIVGHGNTIPDLIKSLGVAGQITIEENDYDNLFVLVLEAKPFLIRLHYR